MHDTRIFVPTRSAADARFRAQIPTFTTSPAPDPHPSGATTDEGVAVLAPSSLSPGQTSPTSDRTASGKQTPAGGARKHHVRTLHHGVWVIGRSA